MIEVSHVSKHYGDVAAVLDVSFEVERGQLFTLIGRSGSGKSTLIKLINRLIEADEGTIKIDGQDIMSQDPVKLRRGMGYVIQNVGLFPHYTVAQNLAVVPKLLGWPIERIRERSKDLLFLLGLDPDDHMRRYPDELSGGQQQRVGIARALVANPPILLMDEPFGSLDTLTKEEIHREFALLRDKLDQTVVWVTHDVQAAFSLSDRLCVLDQGSVKQIGTPADLLFSPANAFIEEFVKDHRVALAQEILTVRQLLPRITMYEGSLTHPFVTLDTPINKLLAMRLGPDTEVLVLGENMKTLGHTRYVGLVSAYLSHQQRPTSPAGNPLA